MIDREKVIKEFRYLLNAARGNCFDIVNLTVNEGEKILALLKEQEAVSAHWDDDTGHLIAGDRDGINPHTRTTGEIIDTFRCSWCGFYQYWKTPFCPHCGAKMEGR